MPSQRLVDQRLAAPMTLQHGKSPSLSGIFDTTTFPSQLHRTTRPFAPSEIRRRGAQYHDPACQVGGSLQHALLQGIETTCESSRNKQPYSSAHPYGGFRPVASTPVILYQALYNMISTKYQRGATHKHNWVRGRKKTEMNTTLFV